MKSFRLILSLSVLFGFTGVANAYRINVLDPGGFTVHSIGASDLANGLNVAFDVCDAAQLDQPDGSDVSTYGCYSAVNNTGSTITTLELIFSKTGLFSSGFECGQDNVGTLSFANVTCSDGPTQIALFFSGGTGIPVPPAHTLTYFTIYVSDLPPGTVSGDVGTAIAAIPQAQVSAPPQIVIPAGAVTTPEPGSLALLSTGLLSVGATAWRKRRRLISRA